MRRDQFFSGLTIPKTPVIIKRIMLELEDKDKYRAFVPKFEKGMNKKGIYKRY